MLIFVIGEASMQINANKASNTAIYQEIMTKEMRFYHIQTIGSECISAGQIQSIHNNNDIVPCLLHGKLENNNTWTITVRTSSIIVSRCILREIQQKLS